MDIFGNPAKILQHMSFRLVFNNRQKTGEIIGDNLKKYFKSGKKKDYLIDVRSLLVIGIPRGGLVVANEIAKKLGCDLDLIYPVRILNSDNETTIGSILILDSPAGPHVINSKNSFHNFLVYLNGEKAEIYFDKYKERIIKKSLDKFKKFGSVSHESIKNKTVIVVDDGVFSGATAITALRWIRTQEPRKLIFATPVAPLDIVNKIKEDSKISLDYLEILKVRSSFNYRTVDYYYKNFEYVEDDHINSIIRNANI